MYTNMLALNFFALNRVLIGIQTFLLVRSGALGQLHKFGNTLPHQIPSPR